MASNKEASNDEGESRGITVTPSELDELTHAELRMLYQESTETLRFVKSLQWKTVGSALTSFAALIFIAKFIDANKALTDKFMIVTILLSIAVIFTLMLYQFWQSNEHAKINSMNRKFSNVYRSVRARKSRREGNIHRYTLLVFMMTSIILGAIVVHWSLDRIAYT